MNPSEKDRLAALEQKVAQLEAGRATTENYGLAKISESEAITETDSGLVLSAKEKNSAIEGTLANKTKKIKEKIGNIKVLPYLEERAADKIQLCENMCERINGEEDGIFLQCGTNLGKTTYTFICSKIQGVIAGLAIFVEEAAQFKYVNGNITVRNIGLS